MLPPQMKSAQLFAQVLALLLGMVLPGLAGESAKQMVSPPAPTEDAKYSQSVVHALRTIPAHPDYNRRPDNTWSWQSPNAKVIPTGGLEWQPRPFILRPGQNIRYIDFEGGDDTRNGLTPATAWQHHPWDEQAEGRARQADAADTYIFKRGVLYRGLLTARASEPTATLLRLTSDPEWGQGEACLTGTERLAGEWKKCPADSTAGGQSLAAVWYLELPPEMTALRRLWEVNGENWTALTPARTPNWEFTDPEDYRAGWFEWESCERITPQKDEKTYSLGVDRAHLSQLALPREEWCDAILWSEFPGVMGFSEPARLLDLTPATGTVKFQYPLYRPSPGRYCRYYLENSLAFLDRPGEFYIDRNKGRLYLRLPNERDPNLCVLEGSIRKNILRIEDQARIEISGLTFRGNQPFDALIPPWERRKQQGAAVMLIGACREISIYNCRFEHVVQAADAQIKSVSDTIDLLDFNDNDIIDAAEGGFIAGGDRLMGGVLCRARIERNRFCRIGLTISQPAISIGAILAEISGNIISDCGGIGINLVSGKGGHMNNDIRETPLIRNFIHHNQAVDCLKLINDYGNIETWMGGPTYIYGNVSGNPGGYRHYKHLADVAKGQRTYTSARFGFAYYLDGAFKNYLFNNIAWGANSDVSRPQCNSAALMEIEGHQNAFVNNTFYLFAAGSRRQVPDAGSCVYLGNLWLDISSLYFDVDAWLRTPRPPEKPIDYVSLAYANNFFTGAAPVFAELECQTRTCRTRAEFGAFLDGRGALAAAVGQTLTAEPLMNPAGHDFRPRPESPTIDRGCKYFVPWGLYGVVGEWNFYRFPENAQAMIRDESIYLTEEHRHREMYRDIPKSHLHCYNLRSADFETGSLEDWTAGALRFDGRAGYCEVTNESLRQNRNYVYGGKEPPQTADFAGRRRQTLDLDTNNFLIEMVVKIAAGQRGGVILEKRNEAAGYTLGLDDQGRLELELLRPRQTFRAVSPAALAQDVWLHLIFEVDRQAVSPGVSLFVNGQAAELDFSGPWPRPEESLANDGDFLVGKNRTSSRFFAGSLDFLRISRGTFREALTSIEDLYHWEFAGPVLQDFQMRSFTNKRRDAGAVESTQNFH